MFKKIFMPVFALIAFATTICGAEELDIIIRDFKMGAFGSFEPEYKAGGNCNPTKCSNSGATTGMVQTALFYDKINCPKDDIMGKDGDPDYIRYRYCAYPLPADPAPSRMCYGETVDKWYVNSEEAKTFNEILALTCSNDGLCGIDSRSAGYFPLDDKQGTWGKDNTCSGGSGHNFGFSVTGSAEFQYVSTNNSDNFAFSGDDDMWVFIDGELVIDLGGIHGRVDGSFRVDSLARARGWTDGSKHTINFFYAERHVTQSNLKLTLRLTNMSEARYGAPKIKKAETTIGSGGADETMIWVSNEIDLGSIDEIKRNGNFPIIIKKSDESVNGYRLSSIEYVGKDDGSYVYLIKGDVCSSKTDPNACNLTIGSGDSLSFNVKAIDAGFNDRNGVTLPSTSSYVKSRAGIEAVKISWAPNATQMSKPPFVPIPGDKNPVKPDFVDEWFTGNPTDGQCALCGSGLPNNGTFPNINLIWDPNTDSWLPSDDPNLKPNNIVHGFGKTGTPIPPNRAGELLLTAFPNASGTVVTNGTKMKYEDWLKDEEAQKLFGLPPKVSDIGPYGIADPKKQAEYGGYAFVKNGFPNESSVGSNGRVAPTRCISDLTKPNEPRINCLNFSLLARQPFQISVILYDQLGNFVTQYRETVTEREFRSVVQGPNYPNSGTNPNGSNEKRDVDNLSKKADSKCKAPKDNASSGGSNFGQPDVITTNGLVKVNVNIYPFSKDGRRFGNGVYIAKIDRVDLPYGGCVNNEGTPVYTTEDYKRYHADQKFGWMRTKPKK